MSRKLKANEMAVYSEELREAARLMRQAKKLLREVDIDSHVRALVNKAKATIDLMLVLGDEDCPF